MIIARLGRQVANVIDPWMYARLKTRPLLMMRSMFGVLMSGLPNAPKASGRWSSVKINYTFGRLAAVAVPGQVIALINTATMRVRVRFIMTVGLVKTVGAGNGYRNVNSN